VRGVRLTLDLHAGSGIDGPTRRVAVRPSRTVRFATSNSPALRARDISAPAALARSLASTNACRQTGSSPASRLDTSAARRACRLSTSARRPATRSWSRRLPNIDPPRLSVPARVGRLPCVDLARGGFGTAGPTQTFRRPRCTRTSSHLGQLQDARGTFKGGFGHHRLGGGWTPGDEALAMVLRPGNAGSNAAADHLVVLERPSRRSRTGGAASRS